MAIYMMQSGANSSSSSGVSEGAIAGVVIAIGVVLLVLAYICSRNTRDNDDAAGPAERAAAAAFAARPRPPPTAPAAQYWDDDEEEEARRRRAWSRRASGTAGLPSFTYNLSVKHNVTTGSGGAGEDAAATCSVCLGAFQVGETVRLLPVCLHLYHVECIDPWLDAHSTCPICRSGTDPTVDGSLLPPV